MKQLKILKLEKNPRIFGKEITNMFKKYQENQKNIKINKKTSISKLSNDKETLNVHLPTRVETNESKDNLENSIISYVKVDKESDDYCLNSSLSLEHIIQQETDRINTHSNIQNKQIPFEYLDEIYNNLIFEEKEMPCLNGYMKKQNDLNEMMRAILIDWVVDVHKKFKLLSETLFLTVYIIDKYLSEVVISRNHLQLVGVTALMLACKYEEIYSPEIRDFVFITEKAYTKDEIIKLELHLLKTLNFELTTPSSLRFFQIISTNLKFTKKEVCFGNFLLELFLIDYRFTKYTPSLIACTVCYLVMKVFKNDNYSVVYEYIQCDHTLLKECGRDLCFLLENIDKTQITAVKRKYSSLQYFEVAKLKVY